MNEIRKCAACGGVLHVEGEVLECARCFSTYKPATNGRLVRACYECGSAECPAANDARAACVGAE